MAQRIVDIYLMFNLPDPVVFFDAENTGIFAQTVADFHRKSVELDGDACIAPVWGQVYVPMVSAVPDRALDKRARANTDADDGRSIAYS